ncbi:MAG: hypothetical protein EOO55_00440 [Hymenobacter sp.]|nr:MAG: hypothetical protein EOO55_00440 [Hymenobacter sp.]
MPVTQTSFSSVQRFSLITACAIPAIGALLFIITYAYNVPYMDSWELIFLLKKIYAHEGISLTELASQHNEHRILFPRIIMLCLARFSSWDARYEIYFGFLLLCISFYVIIIQVSKLYNVAESSSERKYVFAGLCLLISLVVFSLTQDENLLWGWQIQIFLNILAVLLGMLYLTNNEVLGAKSVVLSAFCGIVATYSFANGIIFWPIGAVVLLVRMRQARNNIYLLVAWALIAVVVIFLYMHNYVNPANHPPLTYVLHNPYSYVLYILTYLGAPVVKLRLATHVPASLGGLIGLLSVFVICYFLFKLKIFWKRHILFWHSLLLYTLLSGAITAVGRAASGVDQALSPRYITICNFFWLWIIILGAYVYVKQNFFSVKIFASTCILVATLFAYYDEASFRDEHLHYENIKRAQTALKAGNVPSDVLRYVYPIPSAILSRNEFLRKNHLSFYKE